MNEEAPVKNRVSTWFKRLGKHDPLQYKTLDSAVDILLSRMEPEDLHKLRALPKNALYGLHMGLGMWIRNQLDLWVREKELELFLASGKPDRDDASSILLVAMWLRLNTRRQVIPDDASATVTRQVRYRDMVSSQGNRTRLAWGEDPIALARMGVVDALILPSVDGFTALNQALPFLAEDLGIPQEEILHWANWNRFDNERATLVALPSRQPGSRLRGAVLASGELTRGYARHATPYWGRAYWDFFYNVTYESLNHAIHAWNARRPGLCLLTARRTLEPHVAMCQLEAVAHLSDASAGPALDEITFISNQFEEAEEILSTYYPADEDQGSSTHRPIHVEIEARDAVTLLHLDWTSADSGNAADSATANTA